MCAEAKTQVINKILEAKLNIQRAIEAGELSKEEAAESVTPICGFLCVGC